MSDLDAVPTIETAPTDAAAVKLAFDDLLHESHSPIVDATADAMTDLSPAEEAAVLPAQVADVAPRDAPVSEDAPAGDDATLAFYRTADDEMTLPFYAAEHADEGTLSEGGADVTIDFADQTLLFYDDVPGHGDVDATLPFYHPCTSPAPETHVLDEAEPQRRVETDDEVAAHDAQPVDTVPVVDVPAFDADSATAPLTATTLAYYADASAAEANLDQILLPGYATAGQDLFQPHVAGPSAVSDCAIDDAETVEETEIAVDNTETVAHPVESNPAESASPVALDRSAEIDAPHHAELSTPALAVATPIPPSGPATLGFYAHHDDAHDGEQVLLPEYATHGEPLFSSAAAPRATPTVTIPYPETYVEDLTLAVYHHHHSADQTLPFYRYHHDLAAASMAVSPTSNSSSSGEVIHVDEVASMDGSGSGSGGGSWQIVSDDEDKEGAEEPVEKGGEGAELVEKVAEEVEGDVYEAAALETTVSAPDVPDVVDRDVAVESPTNDAAVQDEETSQALVAADEPASGEPEVVDRSVPVDSPTADAVAQDAEEALPSQALVPADDPAPTIAAEAIQAENDAEPCEAAVEPVVAAIETEREGETEAVPPVEEIEPESLVDAIHAAPEPIEEPAESAVPAMSTQVYSSSEFQDAAELIQEPEPTHIEEPEPALAPAVSRDLAVQEPMPAAEPTVKTTVFVNTADQEGDIDITEGLPEPELVDAVRFEAMGATRSLLTQRRVAATSTTDDHDEADPLHDADDEAASIAADDEDDELLATSPDEDELPVAREPSTVNDLVTAMTTPTTPPSIQRLMHFAFAFLVVSMTVLGVMTYGMEGNLWVWFLVVVNALLWYAVTQVAAFTNDTDAGAEDAPVDKEGVKGMNE
ncbi:hypothetical protein AMAG_03401 [Allomyces macrogynus ATCC 38327]|uniref:Uncharacterized protein n=1 Tax=Allomyces macrogynus (strain ATCC 38327) TaxID=578462 RepID=A0A0L0S9I8_ALLM3|nr:hypothetical protein AMAG_03401 [Allomyces macrogynus ATCC 38327]|eukprot:KNE59054.1 hypothetical protein AMAG_03401 [Allomyces macrogynus ATCC 38327]